MYSDSHAALYSQPNPIMSLFPFQLEPLYSSRLPMLSSTPPPLQFVTRQSMSHITVRLQPATVQNAPKRNILNAKYSDEQNSIKLSTPSAAPPYHPPLLALPQLSATSSLALPLQSPYLSLLRLLIRALYAWRRRSRTLKLERNQYSRGRPV